MKRTAATQELALLNPFVGIWETEVQRFDDPSEPVSIKASDSYEWLPGGYFLFHRYEANLPEGKLIGIEVIGYDREYHIYTLHAFDSQGSATFMQGRLEQGNWSFKGENLRFAGGFHDEGNVFAGVWERLSEDGASWQPWMEVTLNKVV